jgi:hypothetical protein
MECSRPSPNRGGAKRNSFLFVHGICFDATLPLQVSQAGWRRIPFCGVEPKVRGTQHRKSETDDMRRSEGLPQLFAFPSRFHRHLVMPTHDQHISSPETSILRGPYGILERFELHRHDLKKTTLRSVGAIIAGREDLNAHSVVNC